MPHSVYDTEKIIKLKEDFATVCNTEGGKVTKMKDGSVMCELGNNKIKLSKFADMIDIKRDIFNDEPQVKILLQGLDDIIPDKNISMFRGEWRDERWGMFIRYGKIWFSSGGVTGSLSYPITREHQIFR